MHLLQHHVNPTLSLSSSLCHPQLKFHSLCLQKYCLILLKNHSHCLLTLVANVLRGLYLPSPLNVQLQINLGLGSYRILKYGFTLLCPPFSPANCRRRGGFSAVPHLTAGISPSIPHTARRLCCWRLVRSGNQGVVPSD